MRDNTVEYFFLLVKAGLWEHTNDNPNHNDYQILSRDVEWGLVYQLAEDQSVIGIVAAGLDWLKNSDAHLNISQEWAMQFIGCSLDLEQQNIAMNIYIAKLVDKMQEEGIYALLVKGQGIAQCYERPLWRACGDIDLLLDSDNYEKAKLYFNSIAEEERAEEEYRKHKAYFISNWDVELHGNFRGKFLKRVDRILDDVQNEAFENKKHRVWNCEGVEVHLPAVDDDIIFVFTHILQHFFVEGVGLRQVCDWSRLLYTYHTEIDVELLEKRLQKMELTTEWMAFGAFAVMWLGMPAEIMPLYSDEKKWKRKADKIKGFILETGNFGFNRDTEKTYRYPIVIRKIISFFRHTWDGYRYFQIFPMDAVKIWVEMIISGTLVFLREINIMKRF